MKTSELTGTALDWAVAKCEGFTDYDPTTEKMLPPRKEYGWVSLCEYHYSTDWAQGGPIIEREKIDLASPNPIDDSWNAQQWGFKNSVKGETALVAAMRCYVASKLGDDVDLPEELT